MEFGGRNDLETTCRRGRDDFGCTLVVKASSGEGRLAEEPRRPLPTQKPSLPRGTRESNARVKRWGWFSSGRTGLTELRPPPSASLHECMNAGGRHEKRHARARTRAHRPASPCQDAGSEQIGVISFPGPVGHLPIFSSACENGKQHS